MTPGSTVITRLLALALLLLSAACSTSPDKRLLQYLNTQGFGKRYTGNAFEENYVTIGDSIRVQDAYHAELSGGGQVGIDGTVVLFELGAVPIAGMTRTDIEALLTERYSQLYDQLDIKVDITTIATSKQYFIFGEIGGQGGAKTLNGDITVAEAVWAANPIEEAANLGRVRLIRADPRDPLIIPINLNALLRGDSTFNPPVQENDIIYVPPTLLGEFANFLKAITYPITQVLQGLGGALRGGRGGGRRGRNFGGGGFGFGGGGLFF